MNDIFVLGAIDKQPFCYRDCISTNSVMGDINTAPNFSYFLRKSII